ncbi:MAG: hypothetical protein M3498_02150 [Deinococcota bacterium]|jgi:hypothetical protein|nr:hypothetical protein [Deinococcota bacterium]
MNDVLQRLYEARPRLLYLRLEAGRFRLRWVMPLWVLEELLLFALRLMTLLVWSNRYLKVLPAISAPYQLSPEQVLAGLTPGRELLRLPSGEPYLSLKTTDFTLELAPL